jgi:aspartate/methionine/tyrosine aminotransferase
MTSPPITNIAAEAPDDDDAATPAAPPPNAAATATADAPQWASSRVPRRPCAFSVMSRHKQAAKARLGSDHPLLDLSIGSSDLSPHRRVLEALRDAPLGDPNTHAYGLRPMTLPFLKAATDWFAREFGGPTHARSATLAAAGGRRSGGDGDGEPPEPPPPQLRPLDVHTEALALIGAQEGLAHLLLAVCEPGDAVLMSDVAYPPYASACDVASLTPRLYRLSRGGGGNDNGSQQLLPDLEAIEAELVAEEQAQQQQDRPRPRVLLINLPHNPTGAVPSYRFWRRALDFCERHGLLLVSDNPYAALVFPPVADGEDQSSSNDARPSAAAMRAMGFDADAQQQQQQAVGLTAPGALAYALYEAKGRESRIVELFSLSKSHLMGGMRLGFALGSSSAIAALEAVKAPVDFNQWRGLLSAGETALRLPAEETSWPVAREYAKRATALVRSLEKEAGWDVAAASASDPAAAMYVWARLPRGWRAARRRKGGDGGQEDGDEDGDDDDDDAAFCRDLVLATGVALAPGSGFGPGGRGHVRFALVAPADALAGAAKAIGAFLDGRV